MGIIDKLKGKIGTFSIGHNIEVLDRHLFFGDPFKVRVTLKAGKKEVKVNSLEIDLIWEELLIYDSGPLIHTSRYHIDTGQKKRYEKHTIHKQKIDNPFTISPNESYSVDLQFSMDKAPNYHPDDRFYLRMHVDMPKAIDIRGKKDLEVLPEIHFSAPMIAMTERLGFKVKPLKKITFEKQRVDQWTLHPEDGKYPHLGEVVLNVDCPRNSDHKIKLTMNLYEDPNRRSNGIQEEMVKSFLVNPNYLDAPDHDFILHFLSNNIHGLLIDADRDFNGVLALRDRDSNLSI